MPLTSSGYRVLAALALAAIDLSLGACEKAINVGAVNRCGADVEIQADSVADSSSRWTRLRDRDQDSVVQVPENAKTLYVKVRAPGTEEARSFDVAMRSLGKPPADVDYDAQLALEGDWCP
jgi:hypothetical protein